MGAVQTRYPSSASCNGPVGKKISPSCRVILSGQFCFVLFWNVAS